jgi:muramoyltetrapeptide carboxypeptidase
MLNKNDKITILSPSGRIKSEVILQAAKLLAECGFTTHFSQNFDGQHFGFSGIDEARLSDLQTAFDDEKCKGIFCARGGYGLTRIIDRLNWDNFLKNPKIIIGYSDVTALLIAAEKRGATCIHALNLSQYLENQSVESFNQLKKILFGETFSLHLPSNPYNQNGEVKAHLIGGNLSLLTRQIGTANDFSTDGKILFLEDIGEPAYKIDGMLVHLKRAGKFRNIAGLLCGQFLDSHPDKYFPEQTTERIIAEHFAEIQCPKAFQLPFGHVMPSFPLPLVVDVHLRISAEEVNLTYFSEKITQ